MRIQNLRYKSIALVALLAGAGIILAYYFKTAGGTLPLSRQAYLVHVNVADPQDLLVHADVTAAGIVVGSVGKIDNKLIGKTTYANVTLNLGKKIAPIYNNATYIIRQKTLVGENYLEISKGDPSSGQVPPGGTLAVSQDQDAVSLDKVLNSLDPATRNAVSANLRALGAGLDGQGSNLNALFGNLQPAIDNGTSVFSALNEQRRQVADVVQQAGVVFQAIANRTADLRELVTAGKATAVAVASRDNEFESVFNKLPGTLSQVRSTIADLSSFSRTASPVVGNLTVAMRDLHPVVNVLGPTALQTNSLLHKLPALIAQANPLLRNLNSFSANGQPFFPQLTGLLDQTDPALDYLKPYYKDLVALFSNFGAGFSGTTYGRMADCSCPVSIDSFANYTPAEKAALNSLLAGGLFQLIGHVTNNGLKAPNSLEGIAGTPGPSSYPRLTAAAPGSSG